MSSVPYALTGAIIASISTSYLILLPVQQARVSLGNYNHWTSVEQNIVIYQWRADQLSAEAEG